jgi:hypothetical protein
MSPTLYVSPEGNDAWSGRIEAPNASATDGPFATIDRARLAVRALRGLGPAHPVSVQIRNGVYFLASPLVFTPEDSGAPESPTVYEAYPGESPVISGGVKITGWEWTPDGRWRVSLPEVARGAWSFSQLYVNGESRFRTRLPKDGYYTIADVVPPLDASQDRRADGFRFAPGEVRRDWSRLSDVEAVIFQGFTVARMRIASVDDAGHIVRFTGRSRGEMPWQGFARGRHYLLENVKEALSLPGEWYLDRPTGVLTYIPFPGEEPENAEVIAPALPALVRLSGDTASRRWVEGLTFRNLSFAHAAWVAPPAGHNYSQADPRIPGAITATGARRCALENCSIVRGGAYAVDWGIACKDSRVEDCCMMDLGGGGVKIGEEKPQHDPELLTTGIVVRNNTIAHLGRMHPAAVGVWIGQAAHNVVAHNDIYDLYYTGVSLGWTWQYGPSTEHDNLVESNRIRQIGQGVMRDMGAIYHLGVAPGTVIRHNLIGDTESVLQACGIYLDEGSSFVLVENNVVLRTKWAFNSNGGKENIIRNNVSIGSERQIARHKNEPHRTFTVERNIFYFDRATLLASNWGGDGYRLDSNLYWTTGGQPIDFAGATFEEWRKKGQDTHSLIADPLFVDPDLGDFRLKPGSPALGIGFEPIDPAGFGRLTPRPPDIPSPRAFPIPETWSR